MARIEIEGGVALSVELQQRRLHMACLVHESGGVVGIATLEDVLESLVGEIYDEKQGEARHGEGHSLLATRATMRASRSQRASRR